MQYDPSQLGSALIRESCAHVIARRFAANRAPVVLVCDRKPFSLDGAEKSPNPLQSSGLCCATTGGSPL